METVRPLAALLPLVLVACQLDVSGAGWPGEAPSGPQAAIPQPGGARSVVVNGVALSPGELLRIETQLGQTLPEGDFWYDGVTGAWGLRAGPTLGFTCPGLTLGGPLRPDASGGGAGWLTGVFVNGRELHPLDVAALSQITTVQPGRYWIDAHGNWGYEGLAVIQGNLRQLAAAAQPQGSSYLHATQAGYIGSDGETSYFFDPESGASVIPGEGVVY